MIFIYKDARSHEHKMCFYVTHTHTQNTSICVRCVCPNIHTKMSTLRFNSSDSHILAQTDADMMHDIFKA